MFYFFFFFLKWQSLLLQICFDHFFFFPSPYFALFSGSQLQVNSIVFFDKSFFHLQWNLLFSCSAGENFIPTASDMAELNGCENVQGILFSHLFCRVAQQRIQRLSLSHFCSIYRLDARVIGPWSVLHASTSFFHNRENAHIFFICGLQFDFWHLTSLNPAMQFVSLLFLFFYSSS